MIEIINVARDSRFRQNRVLDPGRHSKSKIVFIGSRRLLPTQVLHLTEAEFHSCEEQLLTEEKAGRILIRRGASVEKPVMLTAETVVSAEVLPPQEVLPDEYEEPIWEVPEVEAPEGTPEEAPPPKEKGRARGGYKHRKG